MNELLPNNPTQIEKAEVYAEDIRRYLDGGIAENTKRAYRSDLRQFRKWGGEVPAGPELVAAYLAAHATELAVATLARRLNAISKAHTTAGHADPTKTELVRGTMSGIRRKHGRPQRRVAPLLKRHLEAVIPLMSSGLGDLRDKALLLVGFAGALRRSELVAINCKDIRWCEDGITIQLKRSKTDQYGEGQRVSIQSVGGLLCPCMALRRWLAASDLSDGPVFRSVDRHGNAGTAALSGEAVAVIVKTWVQEIGGSSGDYSGHSLRAGFITEATMQGVPAWAIRRQSRHRSVASFEGYIRTAGGHSTGLCSLLTPLSGS